MKTLRAINFTLAYMAIFVTTAAFAANRGTLHVTSPLTVSGKQLAAGEYIVQWEGDGPTVDLEVIRRKKVVATAHALIEALKDRSVNDASVTLVRRDGSQSLSQVFFSGKGFALELVENR